MPNQANPLLLGVAEFDRLPESALVDIRVVAQLFNVSVPTGWRWSREGRLPKPLKLTTGSTRWRVGDLRKVLEVA